MRGEEGEKGERRSGKEGGKKKLKVYYTVLIKEKHTI